MECLYACIRDSAVVEIKVVTGDAPFVDEGYDHVFDVTNNDPPVVAGWSFADGQLLAPERAPDGVAAHSAELARMESRFKFGNALADRMIKILSVRNVELGKTSTQVNQMISAFVPIEMALRKCALPTALGGIVYMEPSWPDYATEFAVAKDALWGFIEEESA